MKGRTLDELEEVAWGDPDFESHLVRTCHRLRTKPVDEFTVEDLRIMIGQKISLEHLMPRAIVVLEMSPLAEGDYFPGDLLANVIACDQWLQSHPEFHQHLIAAAKRAIDELGNDGKVQADLADKLRGFLAKHSND